MATALSGAASIPAWLDEGITKWNSANPAKTIDFVEVKDSFVWYQMPKSTELGHQQVRERVNAIVLDHGYVPADDEELVTTARPPALSGPATSKKCWRRSFVVNIEAQSNVRAAGDGEVAGQRQRLLTSLVCEDTETWWAAFRVAD
jgi:hypothetical protein